MGCVCLNLWKYLIVFLYSSIFWGRYKYVFLKIWMLISISPPPISLSLMVILLPFHSLTFPLLAPLLLSYYKGFWKLGIALIKYGLCCDLRSGATAQEEAWNKICECLWNKHHGHNSYLNLPECSHNSLWLSHESVQDQQILHCHLVLG